MSNKHPNNMTKEELRELISDMSWRALDLAQHLDWTIDCLRVQYRRGAYERARSMAHEISDMPYRNYEKSSGSVILFGAQGLTDVSPSENGTIEINPDENMDMELNLDDFEQLYQQVEESILTDGQIKNIECDLRHWQNFENQHVGKDHIDIKVKTFRKFLRLVENWHELSKASSKMLEFIKKHNVSEGGDK